MSDLFNLTRGSSALLISMPHCGTRVPDHLVPHLSAAARALPDTDWHIPLLYDFSSDLEATVLSAN